MTNADRIEALQHAIGHMRGSVATWQKELETAPNAEIGPGSIPIIKNFVVEAEQTIKRLREMVNEEKAKG